jgi:hypothetical protein
MLPYLMSSMSKPITYLTLQLSKLITYSHDLINGTISSLQEPTKFHPHRIAQKFDKITHNNLSTILLFLIFGIGISLSWYVPDAFIARGDTYPKINAAETFASSFYLWSEEHFGYFNTASLVIYHWALWAILEVTLGGSLGQIAFYGVMMGGAMCTIYFLTWKLFQHRLASLVVSIFYVFNFFYVNNGVAQTVNYEMFFIPLLMILYYIIVERIKNNNESVRATGIFILATSISIPILYVNPAAAYATIITIGAFAIYLLIDNRKFSRKIAVNLAWIMIFVMPSLSWFVFSNYVFLNYSGASLESLETENWTWTHRRFISENILRLDGSWAWNDYRTSEYKDYYSHPILSMLSYSPMIFAFLGIILNVLLRDKRYLLLISFASIGLLLPLAFLVQSTEPFGSLIYDILPFSFLFREPYSKLMPVILVFMSILMAFAISKIFSASLLGRLKVRLSTRLKILVTYGVPVVVLFLILSGGINLIGRAHLESLVIPGYENRFSIQPTPPAYWVEASDWINNQEGSWKVLLLPNNDYYQMPYEWGYYGVDFVHFYITKPVIMQYYYYTISEETTSSISLLYEAVRQNDHDSFQKLLDYHNVRFIIQRNDIIRDFGGRQIMNSDTVNTFLQANSSLVKVNQFQRLDVYEYVGLSTPFSDTHSENKVEFRTFDGWDNNLKDIQHIMIDQVADSQVLIARLEGSPNVWATISSPPFPADYYSYNTWEMSIAAGNIHRLHLKINEYDKDENFLGQQYIHTIGDGNIPNSVVRASFMPKNPDVSFVTLEIWHGYNTMTLPSLLEIRNVSVHQDGSLIMVGRDETNLEYQQRKINPTLYEVELSKMKDDTPTLLVLAEGFDPLWRARVNDVIIPSMPVLSSFNGFLIEGNASEVIIEFGPQQAFGLLLSFSLLLLLAVLIVIIRPSTLAPMKSSLHESLRIVRGIIKK